MPSIRSDDLLPGNTAVRARSPIYWQGAGISLPRDAVFGWRQILKHKAVSAAAILSLALGIGASLAAFRLIDALFLRPLPIAHPERLYEITYPSLFEGRISTIDAFNYAAYVGRLRSCKYAGQAKNYWRSRARGVVDTTFGSAQEIERAWVQYVSGSMFPEFGMKPALGRLLDARDDAAPGAHPYAVISYAYWSRRFAKDPGVLGRRLRVGTDEIQIIGIAPVKVSQVQIPACSPTCSCRMR